MERKRNTDETITSKIFANPNYFLKNITWSFMRTPGIGIEGYTFWKCIFASHFLSKSAVPLSQWYITFIP